MRGWMLEIPEITIHFIHPTVLATLRDVEFIPDMIEASSAGLALPDLGERPFVQIAVAEPLVFEVGTAPVHIAAGHDIGPEEGGSLANGVVSVILLQFLHGPPTEDHFERVSLQRLQLLFHRKDGAVVEVLVPPPHP